MYLMKFRKLGMLGLSSFIILSACGQNTDNNNKKDNDQNQTQERDKKSDETEKQSNDEVAENNQNTITVLSKLPRSLKN